MPNTHKTVLAMLGQVYQGCQRAGWVKGPSPVTDELRQHVYDYREDGDVNEPRFGYQPEDAERIVAALQEKGSVFALPALIALRCGLRLHEIAGLKGQDVDLARLNLHIKGKNGKERDVTIPTALVTQLNLSRQYLFTPNEAWKQAFYVCEPISPRSGMMSCGMKD
jgi:integrase